MLNIPIVYCSITNIKKVWPKSKWPRYPFHSEPREAKAQLSGQDGQTNQVPDLRDRPAGGGGLRRRRPALHALAQNSRHSAFKGHDAHQPTL